MLIRIYINRNGYWRNRPSGIITENDQVRREGSHGSQAITMWG